jgi:pyrimidine-nucleoside phosphorylase
MYDIINHKKNGNALTEAEINFFVSGFTQGEIPDYQVAALLMAISLKGMNDDETATLTNAMQNSGDSVDLSAIPGIKVDKHSTGGVGDKTTLIIAPIVAACGVPVAKMSGRGLGFTGGTIDKLEAIPGLRTDIAPLDFQAIVREIGLAIIGQSGDIAPADKKIYALRDVTATVDSLPLIASSIMSKKLAAGSDAILLDVKTGSGAFMKSLDDAIALAQAMVSIGTKSGRRVMALVTDMDTPMGQAIGNALEIEEVVATLHGSGPEDLTGICIIFAAYMLVLGGVAKDIEAGKEMASEAVTSGAAFAKLKEMVTAMDGDASVLLSGFAKAKHIVPLTANSDGFIFHMDAEACGMAALSLGAGRTKKEDEIDFGAGIILEKKTGDIVKTGDILAYLHTNDEERIATAMTILTAAITISSVPPHPVKAIQAFINEAGELIALGG